MNPVQALSMLKFIAELYQVISDGQTVAAPSLPDTNNISTGQEALSQEQLDLIYDSVAKKV